MGTTVWMRRRESFRVDRILETTLPIVVAAEAGEN